MKNENLHRVKLDIRWKNVAVLIGLYDFPSFHETLLLQSIVSKIRVGGRKFEFKEKV